MGILIMTNKIRDLDIKLDIISKLLDCIEKYPEERIGQLIQNCASLYDKQYYDDIFYVEDKELLSAINNRISPLE